MRRGRCARREGGGVNLYAYADGDPLDRVDADGETAHGFSDYTFWSASINLFPLVPIGVNPQLTSDKYGQWYFGLGAGFSSGSSIAWGNGRLHPLSPCQPTASDMEGFTTGNSVNYSLGGNFESGIGGTVGGSTSLSAGNATAFEWVVTFGAPGPSGGLSWQYTTRIR